MNDNQRDIALREHLTKLLRGGGAHLDFESFATDFPVEMIRARVEHLPYTAWQVLEHMRIAQRDILEFSRNGAHVSPKFPEGYWPDPKLEPTAEMWSASVAAFQSDLEEMVDLVAQPSTDLFAAIPHGSGQTILREALVLADHNAYHLGGLLVIQKALRGKEAA